jgi:hypothetical protein
MAIKLTGKRGNWGYGKEQKGMGGALESENKGKRKEWASAQPKGKSWLRIRTSQVI